MEDERWYESKMEYTRILKVLKSSIIQFFYVLYFFILKFQILYAIMFTNYILVW